MKSTYSDVKYTAKLDDRASPVQEANPSWVDEIFKLGLLNMGEEVLVHGRHVAQPGILVLARGPALRLIEAHSSSDLEHEVGGVLLGRPFTCHNNQGILIEDALIVETEDNGPTHFTFTADSWVQIHADKGKMSPDLSIVGWFHTHPDLGAFFSSSDVIVHTAAFSIPWQVGLVVDPIRHELCMVGWSNGNDRKGQPTLASLEALFEIIEQDGLSRVPWRYVKPQIIDVETNHHGSRPQQATVFTLQSTWPALPPIDPWWGVLVGGLSLLLNLILLIDRFILAPS